MRHFGLTGMVTGLALATAAGAAPLALDLPQPAQKTVQATGAATDLLLPSGPFANGRVPGDVLPGQVSRSAWRIGQPMATLDLMQRLRANVQAAGFTLIYECQTEDCGGFDFRYGLPILPEPDMHVDLGDFRFLSAKRGDEALTLLVSRSDAAAFVQITTLGPAIPAPLAMASASATPGADATSGQEPAVTKADDAPKPDAGDIGALLLADGSAALDDLAFASGKGALEPGDYASLTKLAAWLIANPDRKVVLVGHTDASGGLAGNIALSKARAAAVRAALIAAGVPKAQVDAQGAGYLAPRASNLTEDGRTKNRRVEVVLTSTQ